MRKIGLQDRKFCMTALLKIPYSPTGRHKYKQYYLNNEGERVAGYCKKQNADLQSCGITNPSSSVVLRYLMLDLDAHRAEEQWKNQDGSLNWPKIYSYLCLNYPKISKYIEYATKSYSKKGVHIIFGFSALPLSDETRKMQSICAQIQSLLMDIFNEIGLGADTGARGLNRDFSTFQNKYNVLHHNKILTKRINNDDLKRKNKDKSNRTPYLLNLFYACQKTAKELEIISTYRLYNNIIVEEKLSKLFLYLMGLTNVKPMQKVNKDLSVEVIHKFKKCSEFESVTLTLKQLEHISGLNERSIKNLDFFNNIYINNLFNTELNFDKSVTISAKKVSTISKRIARARRVLSNSSKVSNRIDSKLIRPENVQKGERNLAIWSWALYYKMAGYSDVEALNKIKLRVKYIENNDSLECKDVQINCIVKSMYSHLRQLIGIKPNCLPEFLANDKLYSGLKLCSKIKPIELRRNPSPSGSPAPASLEGLKEEKNNEIIVTPTGDPKFRPDLILINSIFAQNEDIKKIDNTKNNAVNLGIKKLTVVRYNRKIGLFNNEDKLILCVTDSRHYKLNNLIPKLKTLVDHDINGNSFFHPKKSNKKLGIWIAMIDKIKNPISADSLCGRKKSFAKKVLEFKSKNKLSVNSDFESDTILGDFDIPF